MPKQFKIPSETEEAIAHAEHRVATADAQRRAAESQLALTRRMLHSVVESRDRAAGKRKTVSLKPKRRVRGPRDRTRLIFGDMHGAQMEPQVIASVVEDARRLQPDEIVLLGDMVNCGGFLAAHHVLGYVPEIGQACYEEDIAACNDVLDALIEAAPNAEIHFLEGNHDERPEKFCVEITNNHATDAEYLRRMFAPEYLLRLKERGIKYYRRSQFYHGLSVPGIIKLDKCFFWHGTTAARHAASVTVGQVGGNIVFGHVHRMQQDQIRPVATDVISAWCPGCTCKLAPLWQHTRPSNWTHGEAVQFITASGKFLHLNVPILDGESLLIPLFNKM